MFFFTTSHCANDISFVTTYKQRTRKCLRLNTVLFSWWHFTFVDFKPYTCRYGDPII